MTKMKAEFFCVTFQVQGRGSFPIDMLRYDSACPSHENDSHAIDRHDGERVVTLRRFTKDRAKFSSSPARWASFGWPIVPNSHRTQDVW